MFNNFVHIIFSKKAIIVVLTLLGLLILIFTLISGNLVLLSLTFFFLLVAILEEKTNLLVVRVISRTILSLVYAFFLTLLIILPSLFIYYKIYIPSYDRARHHYQSTPKDELLSKLPIEELKQIANGEDPELCRYEAEHVLSIRDSTSYSPKPYNYFYDLTDEEIKSELSKISTEDSEIVLSGMPDDEKAILQKCMKWHIGGW